MKKKLADLFIRRLNKINSISNTLEIVECEDNKFEIVCDDNLPDATKDMICVLTRTYLYGYYDGQESYWGDETNSENNL